MLHLVVTRRQRRRSEVLAPGALASRGSSELSAQPLYLGFGSYIYDPGRPQLLRSALDLCHGMTFWRGHFIDARGKYNAAEHAEFDAWYAHRLAGGTQ